MTLKKYIPDFITSLNLLCGSIGIILAFKGRFDLAFIAMLLSSLFDFLDGTAARLLGAYSDLGKELDSLSDMVSFGVLPSMMLVNLMKLYTFSTLYTPFWCYVPVVIAVFSGLRLAKFNIDPRQHDSFIGLPTPACAVICGALCDYVASTPGSFLAVWSCGFVFIPVLSIVLAALLVCEIPMFSIKFKKGDETVLKRKRLYFFINIVIISVPVIIHGLHWSLIPLLAFIVYILMNVSYAIVKVR